VSGGLVRKPNPDWKNQFFSPGFLRKRHRLVISWGSFRLTYAEPADLIGYYSPHAARRLNDALQAFSARRGEGIPDLAEKINLDRLLDVGGVGEATVDLWCQILVKLGIDPVKWLDSDVKVLTRSNQIKKGKK
jgi:hypothetical protein